MAPLAALKAGGSLERTAPCSRAARQQSRLLIIPSPSATRRHLLAPLRVAAPEAAATAGASGASAAAPAPRGPSGPSQPASILKISPQLLATGGLDPSTQPPEARASFSGLLTNYFLPVNLDYPGLRILNIDPPVIAVQNFLTAEECDALRSAASGSGRMSRSQVGGVAAGGHEIRTSSTLAMTSEILKDHGDLQSSVDVILGKAQKLLAESALPSERSKLFARPTAAGQFAFELAQVAHYLPGQHFLSHEDAFPSAAAVEKGYQRRATLLVYLNDVPAGGATKFDLLDLAVQPAKGSALLFFPAFKSGRPDARTLHTATAPEGDCEKWISQTWVSCGLATPAKAAAAKPKSEHGCYQVPGTPGFRPGGAPVNRPGKAKSKGKKK